MSTGSNAMTWPEKIVGGLGAVAIVGGLLVGAWLVTGIGALLLFATVVVYLLRAATARAVR